MVEFGIKPHEFDYENVRDIFLEAERLRFDHGWISDHLHEPIIKPSRPQLEAWTTLSALATQTDRLRLGMAVVNNNWRHPSLVARMGAMLDVISKGRFEFILGAGEAHNEQESIEYGMPFARPFQRIQKCGEAVHIIRKMWTETAATFEGRYYYIKDAVCEPKPIQKPYPPISVAAKSSRFMKIVAELGTGWASGTEPTIHGLDTSYERRVVMFNEYCSRVGRKPETVHRTLKTHIIVAETQHELKESIAKCKKAEPLEHVRELPTETYLASRIFGTPNKCIEAIKNYVNVGVSNFIITFPDPEIIENNNFQMLRLFANDVIPAIKEMVS